MSVEDVLQGGSRFHIVLGDDEVVLPTFPASSVDAVVCDPPCGINFMSMKFDSDRGGRDAWINWMAGIARECLRVTKPGGHALVWALPRTSHWTAMAWENAGWEVRDKITHLNCLTPDTELLVNGEWVHHTNCVEGDLALCYDAEHDTFAWGPIQAVYEAHYSDSLYSLRGDRTDQLVTRGHRCPVERGGTTVFVRAEELAQEREARVPVLEDMRELLNALPLPQQNSGRPQHGLSPMRERGASGTSTADAETPSDLRDVPRTLHPEKQRRAGQGEALFSQVLRGTALDEDPRWTSTDGECRSPGSGGVDGCLDGIVQGQDDRYQQPRVEGRGDGVQDPWELRRGALRAVSPGVPVYGSEGRVRDGTPADCGEGAGTVLVTDGDGASHQPQPHGQSAGEPRPIQDQSGAQAVRASRFTTTDLVRIEPVPYDGLVWCVRVPTGAFVARRNGQVFVTGNSEGFPKSHDISKAIDRMAGAKREVVTVPVSPDAQKWEGWGTCLKPASEDWWLLRKPCDQDTVAENVLMHGTGALNIDGTRVPTNPNDPILESRIAAGRGFGVNAKIYGKPGSGAPAYDPSKGRHMANLIVSHTPYCTSGSCYPGCAAEALDRQSGYTESTTGGVAGWQDQYVGGELAHPVERTGYDDAGGASRFFNTFQYVDDDLPDHESFIYTPKPSQSERHEGLPEGGNTHVTVKSISLMSHLVTLITPPGGVVLDPFTGSGTTGVAAMYHSPTTRFIGVEMDGEYHGIATARLSYHLIKSMGGVPNPFTEDAPVTVEPSATLNSMDDLFGF